MTAFKEMDLVVWGEGMGESGENLECDFEVLPGVNLGDYISCKLEFVDWDPELLHLSLVKGVLWEERFDLFCDVPKSTSWTKDWSFGDTNVTSYHMCFLTIRAFPQWNIARYWFLTIRIIGVMAGWSLDKDTVERFFYGLSCITYLHPSNSSVETLTLNVTVRGDWA